MKKKIINLLKDYIISSIIESELKDIEKKDKKTVLNLLNSGLRVNLTEIYKKILRTGVKK
jgi:hypothetical protein